MKIEIVFNYKIEQIFNNNNKEIQNKQVFCNKIMKIIRILLQNKKGQNLKLL